ncbi:MAG TPA: IclR family transcriptional regulator [Chloroflexota bacterium]|nr:IclR family transcriptional regulator [Chloroflexota bacterium]
MSSAKHVAGMLQLFVEESELGVREMSRRLGMSPSWTHEMARYLAEANLLEKDPDSARYRLGFGVVELGHLAQARNELGSIARPLLSGLADATKETAHIGVLTGTHVMFLEGVKAYPAVELFSRHGWRIPTHCTSVGKAILAYESEATVEAFLSAGLTPITPHTITDPDAFRRELKAVRDRGYALNMEEVEPAVRCVGVPVFGKKGQVIAGMSIAGPSNRLTMERLKTCVPLLKDAAEELSRQLREG